jgi:hypothetical protein
MDRVDRFWIDGNVLGVRMLIEREDRVWLDGKVLGARALMEREDRFWIDGRVVGDRVFDERENSLEIEPNELGDRTLPERDGRIDSLALAIPAVLAPRPTDCWEMPALPSASEAARPSAHGTPRALLPESVDCRDDLDLVEKSRGETFLDGFWSRRIATRPASLRTNSSIVRPNLPLARDPEETPMTSRETDAGSLRAARAMFPCRCMLPTKLIPDLRYL